MLSKHSQHTPQQLALAQERKEKREKKNLVPQQSPVAPRPWLQLQEPARSGQRLKVFTWNVITSHSVNGTMKILQGRELFPTSDCLKASQREPSLHKELLSHNADILFLQEVDRLERLLPVLEQAGYTCTYATGPSKKHGCMIAYKSRFKQIGYKVIEYDELTIREDGSEQSKRGSSFRTKNIGLLVALQSSEVPSQKVVAATTHLFWHPRYNYERARQAGILVREVLQFRSGLGHPDWRCLLCGDFNFAPDDPAYSLLVGDTILPAQENVLDASRVVHVSIDPTVPATVKACVDGDDGATGDPDRTITNARLASPEDGLMNNSELTAFFANNPPLRSAYDEGLRYHAAQQQVPTFGNRTNLPPNRHGFHEPEWTSYTYYWKTVLDPSACHSVVTGLLTPLSTKELEPGLPKKGVSASDHIPLVAEILWINNPEQSNCT